MPVWSATQRWPSTDPSRVWDANSSKVAVGEMFWSVVPGG